jgi:hypothetical protein
MARSFDLTNCHGNSLAELSRLKWFASYKQIASLVYHCIFTVSFTMDLQFIFVIGAATVNDSQWVGSNLAALESIHSTLQFCDAFLLLLCVR